MSSVIVVLCLTLCALKRKKKTKKIREKEGDDIRKISDPKLTRSRGSGAPGVKSYKKVEIFVARVVPLEMCYLGPVRVNS